MNKKKIYFLVWSGSFIIETSKIKSTNPKIIFSSMVSPLIVYARKIKCIYFFKNLHRINW